MEPRPRHCAICNRVFYSLTQYQDHKVGKFHQKHLRAAALADKPPVVPDYNNFRLRAFDGSPLRLQELPNEADVVDVTYFPGRCVEMLCPSAGGSGDVVWQITHVISADTQHEVEREFSILTVGISPLQCIAHSHACPSMSWTQKEASS